MPTSALDEKTELETRAPSSKVHAERALTVAMVTHARQLVSIGTRHVEMTDGLRHEGAAADATRRPPRGRRVEVRGAVAYTLSPVSEWRNW